METIKIDNFRIISFDYEKEINEKLDLALDKYPEAKIHRDEFIKKLMEYFEVHGVIPNFEIESNAEEKI